MSRENDEIDEARRKVTLALTRRPELETHISLMTARNVLDWVQGARSNGFTDFLEGFDDNERRRTK